MLGSLGLSVTSRRASSGTRNLVRLGAYAEPISTTAVQVSYVQDDLKQVELKLVASDNQKTQLNSQIKAALQEVTIKAFEVEQWKHRATSKKQKRLAAHCVLSIAVAPLE